MEYNILKEVPAYALADCQSLQKCADCCGYRVPISLAYALYHRWSEDIYCAQWTGNAFNCFTFVHIIDFITSDGERCWSKPRYENYDVVDDGEFPLDILNNSLELYYWLISVDGDDDL